MDKWRVVDKILPFQDSEEELIFRRGGGDESMEGQQIKAVWSSVALLVDGGVMALMAFS